MPPLDLIASGVFEGARIGLAALGFALIFYTTKELHFAFGALMTAAGFVYYQVAEGWGVPAPVAAVVAVLVGAGSGALVQYLFYRRMRDHLGVLLFSFGLAIIIENVLHLVFGPSETVLTRNALAGSVILDGQVLGRVVDVAALGLFLCVWLLLWNMLERRRVGLALRAVMKDPAMSELVGIRSGRIKVLAYAIGSAVGASAGMIDIARTGLKPTSGFDVMLFAFIATMLGAGSLHRVAAWSMGLGVFMALVAWQFPTEFRVLLAFSVMLLYLVLRPGDRGTGGIKGVTTMLRYAAAGRTVNRVRA